MPRLALCFLAIASTCGCASSPTVFSTSAVVSSMGAPKEPLPVTPRVLEQLPKGRYYRFRTIDPQLSYVGRIVRADGDGVEIADVDCERRTTSKVPLLGDIPIAAVKRVFTNTGVGVEILDGNRTLPRGRIASVELLTAAEVDHRLAVKQLAPPADEPAQPERAAAQREQGWHAAG